MLPVFIVNILVLCVLCVGCDCVVAPILARCQARVTRIEIAKLICLFVPASAFLVRGFTGLLDVAPLAIIGPAYVHLAENTSAPVSLKRLVTQIWENGKQTAKQLFGIK